eukprot:4346265-Pleurochrysis_carterae.AAC.1
MLLHQEDKHARLRPPTPLAACKAPPSSSPTQLRRRRYSQSAAVVAACAAPPSSLLAERHRRRRLRNSVVIAACRAPPSPPPAQLR